MKSLFLLIFMLTFACSGSIVSPAKSYTQFSPDLAAEKATIEAIARWSAATGLDLSVSSHGVPIIVETDAIYSDDGESVCGYASYTRKEIVVTTKREKCDYWSFDSLVLHEIGHMITSVPHHSDAGIMAKGGPAENRECIDAASLELICSGAPCTVFRPEC